MKTSAFLPAAILLSIFALTMKASSLIGTSVTGSLTFTGDPSNYFDPGYGFVPPGYLNVSGITVTVSSTAVEFGYDDGANRFTADFTANGLTLSDLVEISGANSSFQMTFADTAFAKQYLIPVSNSLPVTSYSIAGDVIALNFPGGNVTAGQTLTDTFRIAPVPEPSNIGFVGLAMISAAGLWLKRVLRNRRFNAHPAASPLPGVDGA